jgi:hypothetical protein
MIIHNITKIVICSYQLMKVVVKLRKMKAGNYMNKNCYNKKVSMKIYT